MDFVGSTRPPDNTAIIVKFQAYISHFGARTRSHAQEVGCFPHGRDLMSFPL